MTPAESSSNRRQFLKLIAGSPLVAAAYPALPPSWQALVRSERAAAGPWPAGTACPDCGAPLVYLKRPASSGLVPAHQITAAQEKKLIQSVEEAVNVWDFRDVLQENNLAEHWNYLNGGVDDDATMIANRDGFERLQTRPRRLRHAAPASTAAQVFGRTWNSPLYLCPVAALAAYHSDGEPAAARAAAARKQLAMQSTVSSYSYEDIAKGFGEPHWFQLYADPDWNKTKKMLARVEAAGCPVVSWTIDLLGGSNRETLRRSQGTEEYDRPVCQSCHNHQKGYERPMRRDLDGPAGPRVPYTWDYVKRLKDATKMKVMLKGIVTREDAELAVEHGADGVYVSNHGGRAEESLRGTIDSLPEVAQGVAGRVPIFLDSGVRRGTDIFKALARGATMVGIGRPYVWGLGAFGQDGVARVIDLLNAELRIVMNQAGTPTVKDVTAEYVVDPGFGFRRIVPGRK